MCVCVCVCVRARARARVCVCVCEREREKDRNNLGEDAWCSRAREPLAEAHVGRAGLGFPDRRRSRSQLSERHGACVPGARSGRAVRAAVRRGRGRGRRAAAAPRAGGGGARLPFGGRVLG